MTDLGYIAIIVNGDIRCAPAGGVTYAQIVEFAGKNGMPSMTWRTEKGDRSGILSPGDTLAVEPGMRFSVHHTGNA